MNNLTALDLYSKEKGSYQFFSIATPRLYYDSNSINYKDGIHAKNGDVIKVVIDLMENKFKI